MRAYERLLKYVTVRTPSDETSTTVPSSTCQFDLAQDLIREFINMGLPKARTDEKCYVYAQIPATPGYENCPKIGFVAHLDTVSDFCDKKIVPVVTENYDGRDLHLGGSDGRVLSVSMLPHLKDLKDRICGIEVFILNLTFGVSVHGIGKIRIKFFDIKMIRSSANFLIRSKSDRNLTMWDIFSQNPFCHGHDLCNSGFVIRSQNRISIAGDQSTTFEIL